MRSQIPSQLASACAIAINDFVQLSNEPQNSSIDVLSLRLRLKSKPTQELRYLPALGSAAFSTRRKTSTRGCCWSCRAKKEAAPTLAPITLPHAAAGAASTERPAARVRPITAGTRTRQPRCPAKAVPAQAVAANPRPSAQAGQRPVPSTPARSAGGHDVRAPKSRSPSPSYSLALSSGTATGCQTHSDIRPNKTPGTDVTSLVQQFRARCTGLTSERAGSYGDRCLIRWGAPYALYVPMGRERKTQ